MEDFGHGSKSLMMNGWQNGKDREREGESRFLENIILIIGKKKKGVVLSKICNCCRDFWILEFGSRKQSGGCWGT